MRTPPLGTSTGYVVVTEMTWTSQSGLNTPVVVRKFEQNAALLFAVITAVEPIVAQSGNVEVTLTWYVWAAKLGVKLVVLATCAVAILVTMLRPSLDCPFQKPIS
jgi:hypothetical protein